MTVKMMDVPVEDRPRERLLRQGTAALSDAELVALQLGSGSTGASALELAQSLLAEWGGVSGLAAARPEELAKAPGVGPAKAARLAAAFGLAGRLGAQRESVRLLTSEDVARVAQPLIGHARTEQVLLLIADGGSRLKRTEAVAAGTAKSCPMPVREILAAVLRHDGVSFAVAHNHPGGDPTPTANDIAATTTLQKAATATGLRLLDHIVVGGGDWRTATASR
jgi:DNA repair protein RadC